MKLFIFLGALAVAAFPASAGVITFTSEAAFQSAAAITNTEDFESFAEGYLGNPFTSNGITFTQLPGGHPNVIPYVSAPGYIVNTYFPTSNTLNGNGDENYVIELASDATFTAIGFNVVTNQYGAPVVSLFDVSSALIGSYALNQGTNTYGFFGATSTTPIAYATYIVDRGWSENTALDNIQIGSATATPEPATGALLLLSLGLLSFRRRN